MARREFEVIVASAPREKVIVYGYSQAVNVQPGQLMIIDLFAPVSTVGRVQNMYIRALKPVGAASGTHRLHVASSILGGGYTMAESPYNVDLNFANMGWRIGYTLKEPPSDDAVIASVKDSIFDDYTALRLIYTNNTNVAQTGTIDWYVTWVRYDIAV